LCCLTEELATRVGFPFQTHGVLLPLLSQCLPMLDKICRRSLNFVRSCIRHESAFVRFIALHGLYACSRSLFGRNVVFCAQRFNCAINGLIYGRLPIIINSYYVIQSTKLHSIAWLSWGSLLWFGTAHLLYQACYLATSWTTLFRTFVIKSYCNTLLYIVLYFLCFQLDHSVFRPCCAKTVELSFLINRSSIFLVDSVLLCN